MRTSAILGFSFAISVCLQFWIGSCVSQVSEFEDKIKELKNGWEEEQKAIEKIEELGGWVVVEDKIPEDWHHLFEEERRKFVVEVNMVYHYDESHHRFDNENYSDESLAEIAKCLQVKRILLTKTQATNDGLAKIKHLRNVEMLMMWDASKVSDDGLRNLTGFKNLKNLHIDDSGVTAKGIGFLTELQQIERLSLQGNQFSNDVLKHAGKFKKLKSVAVGLGKNSIDDEGLKHLSDCKSLEVIGVQNSGVTDAGISHLFGFEKLRRFYCSGTKVTDEGIRKLKEKFPNLERPK